VSAGNGKNVGGIIGKEGVATLERRGIETPNHICKTLSEGDLESADCVFVMEPWMRSLLAERFPSQSSKVFALREFAGYRSNLEVWDPVTASLAENVRVHRLIEGAIGRMKPQHRLVEDPAKPVHRG
jgi:protein-tyrosine-phosphatase